MKRKLSYVILICLSLLLFSSIVYAAFVMTHNYEANIGYHEITITETGLTNNVTTSDLVFNEPGDTAELKYILNNTNVSDANSKILTKNYSYHYTLSTKSTDSKLLNMIYVYQNNEYCGVLSECLKNGLLDPEYILAGETGRTSTIKFELHNGASTYVTGTVTIPVTVTCNISTVDAQKVLFADADSSNFTKIIDDINSEAGKTVVLTNALNTTAEYTIANNCTIDLCGQILTLGANITIAPGVEVKIINSRSAGSVAGSGKFVLNSADSFIELEATLPQANLQATTYNTTRLQEELAERFVNNNIIVCGQAFDLLGSYVAYNPTVTITNGLTVTNGVVEAATTELATNQVVDVTIGGTLYEFKYIGNDDGVFASIINDDLKHLNAFVTEGNGVQVLYHLFLPTAIKEHNATISWHSSDPTIISNDGVIQDGKGNVTLTATIKVYDKVYTQTYYLFIVQQDNLSKLQYLASQVEKGTTLTTGPTDVKLTQVGVEGKKPLPLATDGNTHYTNWTAGKNLGIVDLRYEIESSYNYLSLDYNGGTNVYLNQITFSKRARVKMIGKFNNDDKEYEVYVNVKIDLADKEELREEIFNQIQEYLDSVSVLQNILDTREQYGVIGEKGDFTVPSVIEDVKIEYTVPSNHEDLYKIEDHKVIFKDLTLLALTDQRIEITVNITVEGSITATRNLTFIVPGAVTTKNFVDSKGNSIIELSSDTNTNTERIFYSFKYQTLQQSDSPYYSKIDNQTIKLSDLTSNDVSKIHGLPGYVLMYDIENTKKLIFEYNSQEIIIDEYDIEVFKAIIAWATGTGKTAVSANNSFNSFINGNLVWITSDGNTTLSDGEIKVILAYAERYQGFLDRWESYIDVNDNILDDGDISALMAILSSDKIFVSIYEWITEDSKTQVTLQNWLLNANIPYDDWYDEHKTAVETFILEQERIKVENEVTIFDYYNMTLIAEEKSEIYTVINYDNLPNDSDRETLVKQALTASVKLQYPNVTDDNEIQTLVNEEYAKLTTDAEKRNLAKKYLEVTLTDEQKLSSITSYYTSLSAEEKNNINTQYEAYVSRETTANYNALTEDDRNIYYSTYFKNNLLDILNISQELLSYKNDGEPTLSQDKTTLSTDEESVIFHYVMSNYAASEPDKYVAFYTAWHKASSKESIGIVEDGGTVTNIEKKYYSEGYQYHFVNPWTSISDRDVYNNFVSVDSSGNVSGALCYDPVFVKIIEWATRSYKANSSIVTTSLKDYLTAYGVPSALSDYSDYKNEWYYYNDRAYNTKTSINEWTVINKYLEYYYKITQVTYNNQIILFSNITTNITSGNTYVVSNQTVIQELNNDYYAGVGDVAGAITLTHDFLVALINAVNEKYTSSIITPYNNIVTWATDKTKEYVLKGYRIKDGYSSISYDEYITLVNTFNTQLDDIITDSDHSDLIKILRDYHIQIDVTYSDKELNDTDKKDILSSIDNSSVFVDIIEKITKLDSVAPGTTSAVYWDNLDTISAEELEKLAKAYYYNEEFITLLNTLIDTYDVTVNGTTVTVTNGVDDNGNAADRTFDFPQAGENYEEEYSKLLKKLLYNVDITTPYKYLSLDKITSTDVHAFEMVKHYSNLEELTFRGYKNNFLFATSEDANDTLTIVSKNVASLERLTMNYCGVSDISSIVSLLNLVSLDLRGNYSYSYNISDTKTYTYDGISNINPLIELAQLKQNANTNENPIPQLSYLNVYNTNLTSAVAEVVLAKLYKNNTTAKLWYDLYGVETLYVPKSDSTDYLTAIEVLSLLYEITTMEGKYIVLTDSVYLPGVAAPYEITWSIENTKLARIVTLTYGQRVERDSNTTTGTIVIYATVTVGTGDAEQTASRYFTINLQ